MCVYTAIAVWDYKRIAGSCGMAVANELISGIKMIQPPDHEIRPLSPKNKMIKQVVTFDTSYLSGKLMNF